MAGAASLNNADARPARPGLDAEDVVPAGVVVCLTGVGTGGRTVGLTTADVASNVVLRYNVVVASVNANKRHWFRAGQVLAKADGAWLARARA